MDASVTNVVIGIAIGGTRTKLAGWTVMDRWRLGLEE